MDNFQLAIAMMAVTGTPWERRDADGRHRQWTAEELDALADWGWHGPSLMGVLAACADAVRWRWRPRTSHRIASTRLSSRVATSQV